MCVLYFALGARPDIPFLLFGNRDEFYDRPTADAGFWSDHPRIFAPRDLVGGGTWLGIAGGKRFAALTNFREPGVKISGPSRGKLVSDFLTSEASPSEYLATIHQRRHEFAGFNLICADFSSAIDMSWFSNRADAPRRLSNGVYGLSNHLLDTPWPKVEKGKEFLRSFLALKNAESGLTSRDHDQIYEFLLDSEKAPDENLPSTGLELPVEKALSSVFIETAIYGTRSSAIVTLNSSGELELSSRTHR